MLVTAPMAGPPREAREGAPFFLSYCYRHRSIPFTSHFSVDFEFFWVIYVLLLIRELGGLWSWITTICAGKGGVCEVGSTLAETAQSFRLPADQPDREITSALETQQPHLWLVLVRSISNPANILSANYYLSTHDQRRFIFKQSSLQYQWEKWFSSLNSN